MDGFVRVVLVVGRGDVGSGVVIWCRGVRRGGVEEAACRAGWMTDTDLDLDLDLLLPWC